MGKHKSPAKVRKIARFVAIGAIGINFVAKTLQI